MSQPTYPFDDVARAIAQFRIPGLDVPALVEAQRKEIEALVEANRAAVESFQALARKQTEILTQAMQAPQEAAKAAAAGLGVGDPVKQTELTHRACQRTLAEMKELADLARRAQLDAIAAVTRRATERVNEGRQKTSSRRAPKM